MSGRPATSTIIEGDFALSVGRPTLPAPPRWRWVALTEIARLESGHTPSREHADYWDGGIPWIGIKDAREHHGGTIVGTHQEVSQLGLDNSAARILPKGTVCLSRTASVGYVVVMGRPMATSQDFVNWVCGDEIEPDYLKYLLIAENAALFRFGKGTTHTTIYYPEVKAFHVCLPPVPEQRRIVAKVDRLLARSRASKTALDEIPPLLERFRESVLAAAFRGDLTAEWRAENPDVEPASELLRRIRAERRQQWEEGMLARTATSGRPPPNERWKLKYEEPEAPDTSALPDLPESWCWSTAAAIVAGDADIIYGIIQPGPVVAGGVPYVRGMDIEDGRILVEQLLRTSPEIAAKYERATLKGGDVLLGIIRATKVAMVPDSLAGGNITQGTARFRPAEGIAPQFLADWLAGPWAQRWLHSKYRGIDMPGLNLRDVRRLPVPVPPGAEQGQVATRLRSFATVYDRVKGTSAGLFASMSALESSLLASAFSGRLAR